MHAERHPLVDRTVLLKEEVRDAQRGMVMGGLKFEVLEWWDLLTGTSWTITDSNFACYWYAMRAASSDLPLDDEVVYGKIRNAQGIGLGHLVHVTELGEEI